MRRFASSATNQPYETFVIETAWDLRVEPASSMYSEDNLAMQLVQLGANFVPNFNYWVAGGAWHRTKGLRNTYIGLFIVCLDLDLLRDTGANSVSSILMVLFIT